MPFPRLPLFYQLGLAFLVLSVLSGLSACSFYPLHIHSIPEAKAEIEKKLDEIKNWEEMSGKFSLPEITIRIYNRKGLKGYRSLYRNILHIKNGQGIADLTVFFDSKYKLTGFKWGNYLLDSQFNESLTF